MKKIFLSLILSLVTIATWARDTKINGIYYNVDNTTKTAEVTQRDMLMGDEQYSGNITIPSSITFNGTEYTVVSIGIEAFCLCADLISVTIPNSVVSIGDNAFSGCIYEA